MRSTPVSWSVIRGVGIDDGLGGLNNVDVFVSGVSDAPHSSLGERRIGGAGQAD